MTRQSQAAKSIQSKNVAGKKLANIFSALGEYNRYLLFKTVEQNSSACVGDLSKIIGVTSSAISQHMKILEMNGLVEEQRFGQRRCYQVNKLDKIVKELVNFIEKANNLIKNEEK